MVITNGEDNDYIQLTVFCYLTSILSIFTNENFVDIAITGILN